MFSMKIFSTTSKVSHCKHHHDASSVLIRGHHKRLLRQVPGGGEPDQPGGGPPGHHGQDGAGHRLRGALGRDHPAHEETQVPPD